MPDQTMLYSYLRKEKKRPEIVIDSREASNRNGKKILNSLEKFDIDIIVKKLDFGDYLIGDVAIERKTVFDLVNTLTQRFLFDQIFRMKEAYPRSIVLIEGYMGLLRKFSRITPESLSGALFAIAQASIPVIPTIDCQDTATFLATSAKQMFKNEEIPPTIRHRPKTEDIKEQQLFMITGLPHIGSVLGEKLLDHFGTARNIFSASKRELMDIKGIGPLIADSISKVLDTPYENRIKDAE